MYVLQGQSGEVTCESESPSVSTLKWERQQDDQSYAAVPKSQINVTKDTKYVRATLKITNAQFADTGTYKCTVSVPPNKSDYKVTSIKVKGRFVCLCVFVYTLNHGVQRRGRGGGWWGRGVAGGLALTCSAPYDFFQSTIYLVGF